MKKKSNSASAFSLVEVTLALALEAFCLIAVFGLVPVGINSNNASIAQTEVTNIVTTVVADLRATPNPIPRGSKQTSQLFNIAIPAAGTASTTPTTVYITEDGEPAATPGNARYQLNVWMNPPASGRAATTARLLVTWPAQASLKNINGGTADTFIGSVESVIALDRN